MEPNSLSALHTEACKLADSCLRFGRIKKSPSRLASLLLDAQLPLFHVSRSKHTSTWETNMKKTVLGSLSAIVLATSLNAFAMDAEEAIEFRQAGYKFMAWNMAKIKAMAIDGDMESNAQQVQAAANSIAATANSGMGALFIPGTEQDVGNTKTRVKPEMFTDIEGVTEVGMAFHTAATELAAAAETGDKAAVAKAFAATGESCKGCHDKFRMD